MAAPVGPVLGSLLSIRMEGKPPGGWNTVNATQVGRKVEQTLHRLDWTHHAHVHEKAVENHIPAVHLLGHLGSPVGP